MRITPIALSIVVMSNVSTTLLRAEASPDPAATTLWYRQPAMEWSQAAPLGNGRLGAMPFGDPAMERILLNEETIWTGGPYQPANPAGAEHLAEIRRRVFDGEYARAHKLFGRAMMGTPVEQMKYQPLGDLWLRFAGHDVATDYRRELNLDTAVAQVGYRVGDVRFLREVLVSPVDQVVAVRLTADRPGQLTFTAQLTGYRNTAHSNYGAEFYRIDGVAPDRLQLHGRTATYLGVPGQVRFFSQARFVCQGGRIEVSDDQLVVTGADAVTILIAAATNFVSYDDVGGDERRRATTALDTAAQRTYAQIKRDHVAEHRRLFRRVEIDLGASEATTLPTDERIRRFGGGALDPQLAALVYQFSRYLLISSSRPGTKPANLQGIWNEEMNPKWDSKFTVNINLQMNYWPAETANLAECVEPLTDMLCEIVEPGAHTARTSYGARGWVLHQNTDLWWATAPMDGPSWGTFSTGGAWLCTHLWEHYLYRPDEAYLRRIYPVLRGASLFFVDTLVEHPREQVLVTCPATSPENTPNRPGNVPLHDEIIGSEIVPNICAGPAIDTQIVRDLFSHTIAAAEILDCDEPLRRQLHAMRRRLAPHRVGRHGQLQEWLDDWDDPADDHRHLSHLYAVYPSSQISLQRTPELARAAARSIEMRGRLGTGFSMAWRMNLWARLQEPRRAHDELRGVVAHNTFPNLLSQCFSTPQVEGALGAGAGIGEMLLQSHLDEIHLLPALPADWPAGQVRGLRARGGVEVDMAWRAGRLTSATLRSSTDQTRQVRYAERTIQVALETDKAVVLGGEFKPAE